MLDWTRAANLRNLPKAPQSPFCRARRPLNTLSDCRVILLNEAFARFLQKNFNSEPWLGGIDFALAPTALKLRFIDENLRSWFLKNKKREFEEAALNFFDTRKLKFFYEEADALPSEPPYSPDGERDIESCLAPFLAGSRNKMALDAARMALKGNDDNFLSPGFPLLAFFGDAGVGKTFLLNLVYAGLKESLGPRHILKTTALAYCSTDDERDFCSRSRVLLDDLHEIENSIDMQSRLTRRLDAARDKRGSSAEFAFIVAFEGGEERLENFAPALRGRLESGLIVGIEPPDLETRLKCAERFNAKLNAGLSRERLLFIARSAPRFSQISGAFRKIEFFTRTRERAPSASELETLLAANALSRPLDAAWILKKVAEAFGLKVQDILAQSRKPTPLLARQMAMFLCRNKLGLSYPEVGRIFGGKDHSTVMHAVKKINKLRDTDKDARELLTKLENATN